MSYINYIDHEYYGRVWFRLTVRNWNGMYFSEEQNRLKGPLVEIHGTGYGVCAAGGSIEEAIANLQRTLDEYRNRSMSLPKFYTRKWWDGIRMRWMMHRWEKKGVVNAVRAPK